MDAPQLSFPTPQPSEPPASASAAPPELGARDSARDSALVALSAPAPTHWIGAHRIDLHECASTNDEAARLARAGARHGTIVTARRQTQGRGRAGRSWSSPEGNLYLSVVLRPALLLRDVPAMTLAIGVAVCETVRAFGVPAALKWPNDVLVGTRKLAGVLLESQSRGDRLDVVIVGIGINLETQPDAELAPAATCLATERGAPVDREAFLAHLLASIEQWADRYVASGLGRVIPVWRALMTQTTRARAALGRRAYATRLGEEVSGGGVESGTESVIEGIIEGLDEDGALLLRDDSGNLHRVTAGDVETVGAPGPAGADADHRATP